MFYFKQNNTTSFKVGNDIFLLTVQIANLGFVTKPQLDMLYSIIQKKHILVSRKILTKLVNEYKLVKRLKSNNSRNHIGQLAFVLGKNGIRLLEQYGKYARDLQSFRINSHNLQANETLIQALYATCFKGFSLGLNDNSLSFSKTRLDAKDALYQGFSTLGFNILTKDFSLEKPIISRVNEEFLQDKPNTAIKAQALAEALLVGGVIEKSQHKSLNTTIRQAKKAEATALWDDFFGSDSSADPFGDGAVFGDEGRENFRIALDNKVKIKYLTLKNKVNELFFVLSLKNALTNKAKIKYFELKNKVLRLKTCFGSEKALNSNAINFIYELESKVTALLESFCSPALVLNSPSGIALPSRLEENKSFQKGGSTLSVEPISGYQQEGLGVSGASTHKPVFVYKPIGLSPYRVGTSLEEQIQKTYSALRHKESWFDINNYDTRPFNKQYNLRQNEQPKSKVESVQAFEADTMITFKRGNQTCRVFIELNNRTERTKTQAQKLINYIYYANNHPNEDILLAIVATDGSLKSPKVNGFVYPEKHLGILCDQFMRTKVGRDTVNENGEIVRHAPNLVTNFYNRCSNLKLILAGVSEAPMRIAQFIVNANFNVDYYANAVNLAKKITNETEWNVKFEPVPEVKKAIKNSETFVNNGIIKYHFEMPKTFGYYHYINQQTGLKLTQPVIAGDEYDLDTVEEVLKHLVKFNSDKILENGDAIPPTVIYPVRERRTHAISLPTFTKMCNFKDKFIAGQIYYYQPRLGIDNNPYLLFELREVLKRYHKDIQQYFLNGYLSTADERKNVHYGKEYLHLAHPSMVKKTRSYQKLNSIAKVLNSKDFAKQLMLTEVPLGVFKTLIGRYQGLSFSIPVIADLPYPTTIPLTDTHVDLDDCLLTPNTLFTDKRKQINL